LAKTSSALMFEVFYGRTSYAYIGATWTVDITDRIFVEGFFGAAAHNGPTVGRGTK
jgi:hypothetical protein